MAYTFVVTALLAKLFDMVPFLRLRAPDMYEEIGMDDAEVSRLSWFVIPLFL